MSMSLFLSFFPFLKINAFCIQKKVSMFRCDEDTFQQILQKKKNISNTSGINGN